MTAPRSVTEAKRLQVMLEELYDKLSDRKWRLFACACCRGMNRYGNHDGLAVVDFAEQVAEGLLSLEEANRRATSVRRLVADAWALAPGGFRMARRFCTDWLGWAGLSRTLLLRCIAGPIPSATIHSAWLAWDGGTIPQMAQGIYDDRAFDRLPILGDALEEAGCNDRSLLDHCRSPGPHARGCWVVDLLCKK